MDRAVREASGDVVITLDCDDTYPVEEIPHLQALVEQGFDLVNTTRVWRRPKAMPFANFLANRAFALAARMLHGIRTTDLHSGMRAYRKSMIDAVQWNPRGPALPVDMLLIPFRRGFKVTDVNIDYREAELGQRLELGKVLLLGDGADAVIGQPLVEGARVLAEVVDFPRVKTMTQKFRRRKNYRRLKGHTQPHVQVKVTHILKAGEATAISGVQGKASVQQVAEQVMAAEHTLQTAIVVRDKVVAAYLELGRMQI
jgi:large subunit ribosomal protein L21